MNEWSGNLSFFKCNWWMQKLHHSWNLSFHFPFGQDHLWLTSPLYWIALAIRYQKKYFRKIKTKVVQIWSQQQYFSLLHSSWQILDNHGEPWRISIYKITYVYTHAYAHSGPNSPHSDFGGKKCSPTRLKWEVFSMSSCTCWNKICMCRDRRMGFKSAQN